MRPLRGVLVDLDDTLYPLAVHRDLTWRTVARRGSAHGLDPDALLGALRAETAASAERRDLLPRALARIGAPRAAKAPLLALARAVDPVGLEAYPGVARALATLRRRVPVALVADGDPAGQRRTVDALGLADAFDLVVVDGRGGRKRRAAALRRAADALGATPAHAVFIGDRPEDVARAAHAGMRAVRVVTGDAATRPDHPSTWLRATCFATAVRALLPYLPEPTIPDIPAPRPSTPAACRQPTEPAAALLIDAALTR